MIRVLTIYIVLAAAFNVNAGTLIEEYRGDLIERKALGTESYPYIKPQFVGLQKGNIAFVLQRMDLRVISEQPIYQKIVVTRDSGDMKEVGHRQLVRGEVVKGPVEAREEIITLGPLPRQRIRYDDVTVETDDNGMFIDVDQEILSKFDDLTITRHKFTIHNLKYGDCEVVLTRRDLNEKFGINYEVRETSDVRRLAKTATWDRTSYRRGDVAELTVTLTNEGDTGGVYRLLGRSVSRWRWLDGKMFYAGDLGPGETLTMVRKFIVPETLPDGLKTLQFRIGFHDLGGAKPQLPVTVSVRD